MIVIGLFLLGLCLGSFVNALVWRLHKQESSKAKKYSISRGRSLCPSCKHELAVMDLIPIFSWLALGGKCRYCKEPIHWQYPLVELATALLFVVSYVFWPSELETFAASLGFSVWLLSLVGLMALFIYDIKYMLLPNKIVFPLTYLAVAATVLASIAESSWQPIIGALTGLLVGGGIFYVLFQISGGKWIGGGDVKLGFLLGILLGSACLSFLMLFIASLLGTLLIMPQMLRSNFNPKMKIPFGPFLIVATIVVKLFGQSIIDAYTRNFM